MYSASSVIAAITQNTGLLIEGIMQCPNAGTLQKCVGNLDSCNDGKEQKCIQHLSVFHDDKKLIVLAFRFVVSLQNSSGFIDNDDNRLQMLIKRKLIDSSLLKSP